MLGAEGDGNNKETKGEVILHGPKLTDIYYLANKINRQRTLVNELLVWSY